MTTNDESLQRQKKIVEILNMLHQGGDFDEAKKIFNDTFDSVDVSEITSAERQLIANGLNPQEIQNLCNVHAAVFKGSISNDSATPALQKPGHPVATMKLENLIISSLIDDELLPVLKKWQQDGKNESYLTRMRKALADLATIDKHYTRKENTLFPLMDKYGITAPPQVMWGVDDKIRGLIKHANQLVKQDPLPDKYEIETAIEAACKEVTEMIFKEEAIMIPMLDEVATSLDWQMVREDEENMEYTLIPKPIMWKPTTAEIEADKNKDSSEIAKELNKMAQNLAANQNLTAEETVPYKKDPALAAGAQNLAQAQLILPDLSQAAVSFTSGGKLSPIEIEAILRALPLELTFVDKNDNVKWFTGNPNPIFPRTKSVLGRSVFNCHPPKALPQVKKIFADFHAGKETVVTRWFNLHDEKFIYIQYMAIKDSQGNYLGCLESVQDIKPLRELDGEMRRPNQK